MEQKDDKEIKDICTQILDRVIKLDSDITKLRSTSKEPADDLVLDYLDVCQILHISVRQLRRLHQRSELVGFKSGRHRHYLSSEVQQYMKKIKEYENH